MSKEPSKKRATKRAPKRTATAIAAPLPAPDMSAFMTRTRANEGQKIPLWTPEGEATAHWIQVRGIDSDAFTRAKSKQTRRTAEIAALPEGPERDEAALDATLELYVALVSAWSFDMECNHDNVKNFLREAPQIAAEIDKLASRRTFFFRTLKPTQPPSSP